MRVIVTGSRRWTNRAMVTDALRKLYEADEQLTLIHGACLTGADWIADTWGRDAAALGLNVTVEAYAADWDRHGKAAGPVRNQAMVADGADYCLAFVLRGVENRGTGDCVTRALRAGIDTTVIHDELPGDGE